MANITMMKKDNKKTIVLIIASIVTLVLGAVAVITSLRLRETDVAVTPSAPESKPSAAAGVCTGTVVVPLSSCNEWCDEDSDCRYIGDDDGIVNSFQDCVDAGNPVLESYPLQCIHDGITYTDGVDVPHGGTQMTCLISSGETSGVCRHPDYPTDVDCDPGEDTQLSCNEDCNTDDECEGDLVCDEDSNTCRNESCSDEIDCSCPEDPVSCNESCDEDSDCDGDLICDGPTSSCRNADCTGEEDCSCSTSTPTPTPTPTSTPTTTSTPSPSSTPAPTLPDAGSVIPTTTLLSMGLAFLVIGALSILAL